MQRVPAAGTLSKDYEYGTRIVLRTHIPRTSYSYSQCTVANNTTNNTK